MARAASDFGESPGLRAAIGLQRKLDEMCNPSWMRQVEQMEHIGRQLSGSLSAYQTLHPAILSSASAVAQAWPTDRLADVWRRALEVESAIELLVPALEQYTALQSALSDRLTEWSAITEAMQGASLAQQQAHVFAHTCTLAESLVKIASVDDVASVGIPSELSVEDQQLLTDEMTSILTDVNEAPSTHLKKMNWEQRIMRRLKSFSDTHPLLAAILVAVILPLLLDFLYDLGTTKIGQPDTPTKVYEEPRTTAPIIFQLEPLQQVKVIGEQPYYFQVELTDGNTQEIIIGFVSKRSLKEVDTRESSSTLDEP